MPSHALLLPVGGECFLNASIKCRILPDRCNWDPSAGRDSRRSTPLPDSLLQRMVQEVICQSSLQPLLLSKRKMYDIWKKRYTQESAWRILQYVMLTTVWFNLFLKKNLFLHCTKESTGLLEISITWMLYVAICICCRSRGAWRKEKSLKRSQLFIVIIVTICICCHGEGWGVILRANGDDLTHFRAVMSS